MIFANIAGGLVVLPGAIRRNLEHHLPFLASERLLMAAAKAGGDRQELHEAIRRHSHAATAAITGQVRNCQAFGGSTSQRG